jgi:hypothetical protein
LIYKKNEMQKCLLMLMAHNKNEMQKCCHKLLCYCCYIKENEMKMLLLCYCIVWNSTAFILWLHCLKCYYIRCFPKKKECSLVALHCIHIVLCLKKKEKKERMFPGCIALHCLKFYCIYSLV